MNLYKYTQEDVMDHFVVADNLMQGYEVLFTSLINKHGESLSRLSEQKFNVSKVPSKCKIEVLPHVYLTAKQIAKSVTKPVYLLCTGVEIV